LADDDVGYIGTAEAAEPLDEEDGPITRSSFEAAEKASLNDPLIAAAGTENLSWTTRFVILALIVAACFAFVRANTPRRTGPAGRHGAYEKGALP